MNGEPLKLAFVGDVCLARIDKSQADAFKASEWPAIRAAIGEHDILVGNLECCLVDDRCNEEARRQPMAVPAEAASFLRNVGFSHLGLANNHMLDCGSQAIEATRECLTSHGIHVFGAGRCLRHAEETIFTDHGGHRVAFLGACDQSAYYAGDDGPAGIAPLEKSRLGRRTRAAAADADLVVVMLHADLEFSNAPGRWRQRLSRWLIEQGAHLVIQHHPHVLQGIEAYQDSLIAYSLGNFIFRVHGNRYQERNAGVDDSAVLVVDADLSGATPKLTHRIVPVAIRGNHLPHRLTGRPREEAMQKFQELSALVADRREHRRTWFRRCRAEAALRIGHVYYAMARGDIKRGSLEFWQCLAFSENRRWIVGLISLGHL